MSIGFFPFLVVTRIFLLLVHVLKSKVRQKHNSYLLLNI